MSRFIKFVYTPAGSIDATLAISACRADGIGVLNTELHNNFDLFFEQLEFLSRHTSTPFGVKADRVDEQILDAVRSHSSRGLKWLIIDGDGVSPGSKLEKIRELGVQILVEIKTLHWPDREIAKYVNGLVLKGNESGGFVGGDSSYIMFQKWLKKTNLPLYLRGGVTPYVAASCHALGCAGGVLDSQVLLLEESPLAEELSPLLSKLSGNETVAVGDGETGKYFRLLVRPGLVKAREFCTQGEGKDYTALRDLVGSAIVWDNEKSSLLPVGQDVCFAGPWKEKYGHLANVFTAIDRAVDENLLQATVDRPFLKDSPLAQFLGTDLPIVQGPMSRVSDNPEFAEAVSRGGGLPMLALGLSKGKALVDLLEKTQKALGDNPWGVGVLGFAPQDLLDEQITPLKKYGPGFAVIAGGRPDQAVKFQQYGIVSFLHVPSANLIPLFLQQGARSFIFEGRECGGHIGPLSSFVLWSTMIDALVSEICSEKVPGDEIQVLFAGGIHDSFSSGIVQVLAAPLVRLGVKIGVIMGSGYVFTKEIVECGAIVPTFQKEALACDQTVNLESGPGHASRCVNTPFAKEFFRQSEQLRDENIPADERRRVLDDLILGRLRIAAKGCVRVGPVGELKHCDEQQQKDEGMFMLGQLATLREEVVDIQTLHRGVSEDATNLLLTLLKETKADKAKLAEPVDVAIIGVSSVLPGASSTQEYWENILGKVESYGEIPPHRWDWQLYFNEDRQTKDTVYSKWGGFLDDMAFDPTRYGMPPKSVESVDPMQLMALEVARKALADSGYESRTFDREKASVIIGASGGAGDVGMQYGLRAELPRFLGDLPPEVADQLPEWTEDTFAGILLNVLAGRIANRLNLGGVNFTTDAACASSLAAIYQGIAELAAKRSDLILAGGVDTVQGPFGYMCFSKTHALSPRGKCNTFDVSSDGIVISEGLAMVVLKRYEDAKRDGDRIYAVIKGIGGGSDGKAKGLTAPLPAGQLRAMRRAYEQAGFGPETVELFEAHGTGTVAGDTAELESTTRLIQEAGGSNHQAVVGSVKTLIGHTKATAGVAGIIKAALALHHRILPPHGGVTHPNQVFRDSNVPLYLLDKPRPWLKVNDTPRRAASSAFGFGGTNFHLVMEEYTEEYRPWKRTAASQQWPSELFVWSAADSKKLTEKVNRSLKEISGGKTIELRDVAYNLALNWKSDKNTIAIVASDLEDLKEKIEQARGHLEGQVKDLTTGVYSSSTSVEGKVAVLFSGQGSQYTDMLQELACHFQVYSETLSEADNILEQAFNKRFGKGKRLSHFIFPRGAYDSKNKRVADKTLMSTDVAQPALGAVEAGLWRLMCDFGLDADMVGGHSYGEYVALYAAGCLDFPTLMNLSEARGRCIVDAAKNSKAELGTMVAVMAQREEVEEIIADINDVVVANHNTPTQSIISGSISGIKEVTARIKKADVRVVELSVSAAFHSPFVAGAQEEFVKEIGTSVWQVGELPVYSNTTAKVHGDNVDEIKTRMAAHLVKPVEFTSEIEAMYHDGARTFLELGPKTALCAMTSHILKGRPHNAIAIEENGGGINGFHSCLAQLLCAGGNLDLVKLYEGRDCLKGILSREKRKDKITQNTWMLNGSGVRRASEPIKHVGVKKDALKRKATPISQKSSLPASVKDNSIEHKKLVPARVRKEVPKMGGRRQSSGVDDITVMDKYFATMHQFLETQENVMSMYLGGQATGRVGKQSTHPRRVNSRGVVTPPESSIVPVPQQTRMVPEQSERNIEEATGSTTVTPSAIPGKEEMTQVPPQGPEAAQAAPPGSDENKEEVVTREEITALLLSIIEEKTGYPKDMIGLDQNLEADLGIDSIKRVEIVGAVIQMLPEKYNQALGEEGRTSLNTQATLNGMLDLLCSADLEKETSLPFDKAGTERITSEESYPFRHVVKMEQEIVDGVAETEPPHGFFLVTDDGIGVSEVLSETLVKCGCTVEVVDRATLQDLNLLKKRCVDLNQQSTTIAGILHLAPLGSEWVQFDSAMDAWRRQIQLNEKTLFSLLHNVIEKISAKGHVFVASGLGGFFSRQPASKQGLSLQGGSVGLLKSLLEERPELKVKAIDLDLEQTVSSIAQNIFTELELVGGRQEVGYPEGVRTIFKTVPEPFETTTEKIDEIKDAVILATGGLRGITAEVLRELAVPGNTFVLTGRSALPGEEQVELQSLTTPQELQKYYISKVQGGELTLTPVEIKKEIASILAAREMRNNLEDFTQKGAAVDYQAVDVTNEADMAQLMDYLYKKYGKIDGVVHGAGIIEDKLLADKTEESWSRVVETKVLGLLLLQKNIKPELLKFFNVFSSVAGRYGNSGQIDYATANELMSRLCCQLRMQWPDAVSVRSFCWGPWGKTKFGAGMVTAETEAKFSSKGVTLVTPDSGREVFRYEIIRGSKSPVEIISGQGPWEEHEAARGSITLKAESDAQDMGPLLTDVVVEKHPKGDQSISFTFNQRHIYLQEHCIDDVPVVPAAVALEIIAEAAASLWPGWLVAEIIDFRLLKGIELKDALQGFTVAINQPPYGSSDGFETTAVIQSQTDGGVRFHYRAVLRLAQQRDQIVSPPMQHVTEKQLTVSKAYNEWLFHGPRFQVIEDIEGLSENGAAASVRTTRPSEWVDYKTGDRDQWVFEPALIDAAAQMGLLWARAFRNESALPTHFGRVVRYKEVLPEKLHMHFERIITDDPHLICANVNFYNENEEVVFAIEELKCVSSEALNRLGGTAKRATVLNEHLRLGERENC